jgi:hypothetical protein
MVATESFENGSDVMRAGRHMQPMQNQDWAAGARLSEIVMQPSSNWRIESVLISLDDASQPGVVINVAPAVKDPTGFERQSETSHTQQGRDPSASFVSFTFCSHAASCWLSSVLIDFIIVEKAAKRKIAITACPLFLNLAVVE